MRKLILVVMLMLIAVPGFAEWDKDVPESSDNLTSYPTEAQANNDAIDLVLSNYRKGMAITYSSASQITVTAGEVVCSNSGGTLRKFRSNTSSTNVTFSDIDTGSEASATTYYVYANCDAVATTATFKLSTSSSAPSGVTYYKKLGSIYNDGSSNIDKTKIYDEPYGNIKADATGRGLLTDIRDYGSSTSAYTARDSGDFKFAYGRTSVGAATSVSVSGLPFSSSSTYTVVASENDSASSDESRGSIGVSYSSGSAFSIYNTDNSGHSVTWMAFGI